MELRTQSSLALSLPGAGRIPATAGRIKTRPGEVLLRVFHLLLGVQGFTFQVGQETVAYRGNLTPCWGNLKKGSGRGH